MSILDDLELVGEDYRYLPQWAKVNNELEKAYDNDLLLNDNTYINYGLKNTMRHFVGGAFSTLKNGEEKTRELGRKKEISDYRKGKDDIYDTILDFRHNNDGIEYAKQHPNSTLSDFINAGYEYAKKNYLRDYFSGNNEKYQKLKEEYIQNYYNRK